MIQPAKIQVRFSDLDIMGHVNNSIYLSYFEYARVHYFKELLGEHWDWTENGVLLVRNEVEYISPIFLNDEPVITIRTEHIGSKSFTMLYRIEVNGKHCTSGKSVLVCYDAKRDVTIEIPTKMKIAISSLL